MSYFEYKTRTSSVWDAVAFMQVNDDIEFQLGVAISDHPQHEIVLHQEGEVGEPSSPVIATTEISPSGMYVDIHFKDSPIYITMAVMATITLGWLEEQHTIDDPAESEIAELEGLLEPAGWPDQIASEPPAQS